VSSTRTLGEICTIQIGRTPSRSDSSLWDREKETGNVWVSIADMPTTGVRPEISDSKEHISDKAAPNVPSVSTGTLLLSFKLTIGRLAFAGRELRTNEAIAALSILDESGIAKEYLYWYLKSFDWEAIAVGDHKVKGKTLNKKKIASLPIRIPCRADQHRIVAKLDRAFAEIDRAIENAERGIEKSASILATERERLLVDRPDWECVSLGDLVDIKHGFAFKSEWFADHGDHVLLTPGNFYETGGYRYRGDKQKYYAGDIPADFVLKSGDLLVAMTEQAAGLLGSPLIVPDDGVYLHNQRLGLVQPFDTTRWHTGFFLHTFNTRHLRAAVHATASGVKVRHTSPKKLSAVSIWIPKNASEMDLVAQRLDAIAVEGKSFGQVYEKKLTALRALKQSILAETFSFPEDASA